MEEKRTTYRLLVRKPEGRQRNMWIDNIKMDQRWDGVVLTGLVWLRLGIVENPCRIA
jgi:hypothetical protein